MPGEPSEELVLVLTISSLLEDGFEAMTPYEGGEVRVMFDERDDGVFLTKGMSARARLVQGQKVAMIVEGEKELYSVSTFSGNSDIPRISDSKVYYAIGREAGAILRIRKS